MNLNKGHQLPARYQIWRGGRDTLAEELLRFFRNREYAVVDGCQVQLFQNRCHLFLFFLRFRIRDSVVLVGLCASWFQALHRAHQVHCCSFLVLALDISTISSKKAPFGLLGLPLLSFCVVLMNFFRLGGSENVVWGIWDIWQRNVLRSIQESDLSIVAFSLADVGKILGTLR